MNKRLLQSEKDFYTLLDEIYNIIPDDNIHKAVYKSKEEQYAYQISNKNMPTEYPCIMVYDVMEDNHTSYLKQYINNKNYYFIKDVIYITIGDFKGNECNCINNTDLYAKTINCCNKCNKEVKTVRIKN